MTPMQVSRLRMLRWQARTDLGFLCREILGYPDVMPDGVHAPILNILQQFPIPNKEQFETNDKLVAGSWQYTPIQRHSSLDGGRRVLLLDPRGWLKTTINAQAHSIQWILNYPDIALMIVQSNLEKAEMILGAIKKHFQYNPIFRQLFPDHCPMKGIDDFGTKGKFTTKARGRHITRGEESFTAMSIDSGTAGIHVDVMKFSDIVDPSNIGTPEQMNGVIEGFYQSQNLLVGPNYWIDVEGTRYDFGDLYGRIIETEKNAPAKLKSWKIHARGCYKKKILEGIAKFTPEELELDDFIDEKGERIPHWIDAERGFTYQHFETKRLEDPYLFSCQQENNPKGGVDGKTIFPVIKDRFPKVITRENFVQNVRVSHYIATVDTAYTKNERSNYSVITIGAFASDGRVYVTEIDRGKYLPNELVDKICLLTSEKRKPLYGNQLTKINIEQTGFTMGLQVSLNSFQHLTGRVLPIEMIKRDTQLAKQERIQTSLQPYYTSGKLVFLTDLSCWDALEKELRQFPRGQTDDILDTVADLFQGKEWFGREIPKLSPSQFKSRAMERMLGIEDPYDRDDVWLNSDGSKQTVMDPMYIKTGGL